jgi:hypothetical protein
MLYSTKYYLESTSTFFLQVVLLCLALLQRVQRLDGWLPSLLRTLFFAFFLSLRALNSLRVVKRTPSSIVKVLSCCSRFLLCNLRLFEALLAA